MLFSPNAEGSLVADWALEQFAELSDGQEGTQPLGSVIAMQGHCMRGSVSYLSGSVSPSFQVPPSCMCQCPPDDNARGLHPAGVYFATTFLPN